MSATVKNLIAKLKEHNVIWFVGIGIYNTIIDFLVFLTLYYVLELPVIAANTGAFLVANIQSYVLNKYLVFERKKSRRLFLFEYLKFISASTVSFLIGTSILVLGEGYVRIEILKIISIAITPVVSYFLYRFFTFGRDN